MTIAPIRISVLRELTRPPSFSVRSDTDASRARPTTGCRPDLVGAMAGHDLVARPRTPRLDRAQERRLTARAVTRNRPPRSAAARGARDGAERSRSGAAGRSARGASASVRRLGGQASASASTSAASARPRPRPSASAASARGTSASAALGLGDRLGRRLAGRPRAVLGVVLGPGLLALASRLDADVVALVVVGVLAEVLLVLGGHHRRPRRPA